MTMSIFSGDDFAMGLFEQTCHIGFDVIDLNNAMRPVRRISTEPNLRAILLLAYREIGQGKIGHFDLVKTKDGSYTYAPNERPCVLRNLACQQAILNPDSINVSS